MNYTTMKPINIALELEIHTKAQSLAAQQNNVYKGKQVYLNTLAIYSVHQYLRWLQIDSDLENSDIWDLGLQSITNTADLLIPDIGRLECCPVLPQETHLTISPQATEARIGYVAVQFANNLDGVQLIGFLPPVTPTNHIQKIPLTKLLSLESLLQTISPSASTTKTETNSDFTIDLSKWRSRSTSEKLSPQIFDLNWLGLDILFGRKLITNNLALRKTIEQPPQIDNNSNLPFEIRRGKLIDLGNETVALIVNLTPATEETIDILIQLYPVGEKIYLPANLELKILDETKVLIPQLVVKARNIDNCIQLSFTGDPGEKFSVTLTLGEFSSTENFQI